MKKIYGLFIILGIICFGGIIYISAASEKILKNFKTIGFFIIGYIGAILFSYGWIKIKQRRG